MSWLCAIPVAPRSVRIGAPPFLAWTLVPRLLHDMAMHGNVPAARIVEGRLGEIGRQLEEGEIDVLITMNTPSELGGLKPDGFVIEQIGTEQWTVVCSPAHPLAPGGRRPAARTWREVLKANWILPPRPTTARIMVEQIMLQNGLTPIVPHIELMNAITNLQLVERSLGITLVPRSVVEDRIRRATLAEIPMLDLPPPVPIVLVYRLTGARRGALSALLAAAQRVRNENISAPVSDRARTRKLPLRKSRR